jgi:hypothetical protein
VDARLLSFSVLAKTWQPCTEELEEPDPARAGVASQPDKGDTDPGIVRAVAGERLEPLDPPISPAQRLPPARRPWGQRASEDYVRRLCTVDALLGHVVDGKGEGFLIDNEGPIDVRHRPPRHVF